MSVPVRREPGERPFLELAGLAKSFDGHPILSGVDLAVPRGEVLALLGPSGSGKTTLLRLLAGFETADAGSVHVEGEEVTRLSPERRGFGMVFQHYALFPHLSVGENVAFGLAGRGLEAAARRHRVEGALALVGLAGFGGRRVQQISGGQQQRVALARALAPNPRLLLLDEPLSNLDPGLRERTRRALAESLRSIGITTILVTHEQEEAFELGDRVAVLDRGRLVQAGRPEELYGRPASRFVATFVGRASVLPALLGDDGRVRLRSAAEDDPGWRVEAAPGLAAGDGVELVIRPEALGIGAPGATGSSAGVVVARRFAGPTAFFTVRLDGGGEVEVMAAPAAAVVGERVGVTQLTPGWAYSPSEDAG